MLAKRRNTRHCEDLRETRCCVQGQQQTVTLRCTVCLSLAADRCGVYGHTETVRYLVGLPEVEVNYREGRRQDCVALCGAQEPFRRCAGAD